MTTSEMIQEKIADIITKHLDELASTYHDYEEMQEIIKQVAQEIYNVAYDYIRG